MQHKTQRQSQRSIQKEVRLLKAFICMQELRLAKYKQDTTKPRGLYLVLHNLLDAKCRLRKLEHKAWRVV